MAGQSVASLWLDEFLKADVKKSGTVSQNQFKQICTGFGVDVGWLELRGVSKAGSVSQSEFVKFAEKQKGSAASFSSKDNIVSPIVSNVRPKSDSMPQLSRTTWKSESSMTATRPTSSSFSKTQSKSSTPTRELPKSPARASSFKMEGTQAHASPASQSPKLSRASVSSPRSPLTRANTLGTKPDQSSKPLPTLKSASSSPTSSTRLSQHQQSPKQIASLVQQRSNPGKSLTPTKLAAKPPTPIFSKTTPKPTPANLPAPSKSLAKTEKLTSRSSANRFLFGGSRATAPKLPKKDGNDSDDEPRMPRIETQLEMMDDGFGSQEGPFTELAMPIFEDSGGKIDFPRFQELCQPLSRTTSDLRAAFDNVDDDKDGFLTSEQCYKAIGPFPDDKARTQRHSLFKSLLSKFESSKSQPRRRVSLEKDIQDDDENLQESGQRRRSSAKRLARLLGLGGDSSSPRSSPPHSPPNSPPLIVRPSPRFTVQGSTPQTKDKQSASSIVGGADMNRVVMDLVNSQELDMVLVDDAATTPNSSPRISHAKPMAHLVLNSPIPSRDNEKDISKIPDLLLETVGSTIPTTISVSSTSSTIAASSTKQQIPVATFAITNNKGESDSSVEAGEDHSGEHRDDSFDMHTSLMNKLHDEKMSYIKNRALSQLQSELAAMRKELESK
jgi:Ca2+-binding EF-hand superfamily protein